MECWSRYRCLRSKKKCKWLSAKKIQKSMNKRSNRSRNRSRSSESKVKNESLFSRRKSTRYLSRLRRSRSKTNNFKLRNGICMRLSSRDKISRIKRTVRTRVARKKLRRSLNKLLLIENCSIGLNSKLKKSSYWERSCRNWKLRLLPTFRMPRDDDKASNININVNELGVKYIYHQYQVFGSILSRCSHLRSMNKVGRVFFTDKLS